MTIPIVGVVLGVRLTRSEPLDAGLRDGTDAGDAGAGGRSVRALSWTMPVTRN